MAGAVSLEERLPLLPNGPGVWILVGHLEAARSLRLARTSRQRAFLTPGCARLNGRHLARVEDGHRPAVH